MTIGAIGLHNCSRYPAIRRHEIRSLCTDVVTEDDAGEDDEFEGEEEFEEDETPDDWWSYWQDPPDDVLDDSHEKPLRVTAKEKVRARLPHFQLVTTYAALTYCCCELLHVCTTGVAAASFAHGSTCPDEPVLVLTSPGGAHHTDYTISCDVDHGFGSWAGGGSVGTAAGVAGARRLRRAVAGPDGERVRA